MNIQTDLPTVIKNDFTLKWFSIKNLDDFKNFLTVACKKGVTNKYPYKPTKDTRLKEDGTEFVQDDVWLDTEKDELWILITKTQKHMGWYRFKKALEGAGKLMYQDFLEFMDSKRNNKE